MTDLYDPKDLSRWMDLDYVHSPLPPVHRQLRSWTWFALGASAALILAVSLWPGSRRVYQAGPLATAHAMFNNNCGVCHTQHFQTVGRLWQSDRQVHSVSDDACLKCHPGPAHNNHVAATNCASCHREHHGQQPLALVPDGHCTNCHADLKTQFAGKSAFRNVASFQGHPEFALWSDPKDTETVKFNHERHLNLKPEECLNKKQLVANLQSKQCSACHQPDAAGRYMQPIQYDQHCAACHPLNVQIHVDNPMPDLAAEMKAFAAKPLPHPKLGEEPSNEGPAMVQAVLRDRLLQFAQQNRSVLKLKQTVPERPLLLPSFGEPATKAELEWSEQQLVSAKKVLFGSSAGCQHCHTESVKWDGPAWTLPVYSWPSIEDRWLPHSLFSHKAHQMVTCADCHTGVRAADGKAITVYESQSARDVLMPKIATCQQCHGTPGGARSDCVACHAFHKHAAPGNWKATMSIDECKGLGR